MRRITILALAAVLALFGAACGGDDDDSGGEDNAATSDGGDDGSTTDDGDDGGDAGEVTDLGDLIDDDCEFLLAGAFMNPLGATGTGEDVDIDAQAEQLQSIADGAPDEISDAMSTLAEGYVAMAELLQGIDLSDPESFQDPEVLEKMEELNAIADDEYNAAAEDVSTWMSENCTGVAGN